MAGKSKFTPQEKVDIVLLGLKSPGGYPIHWWAWDYDNNGNQLGQMIVNGTTGPYYTYDFENRLTNVRLNPDNPGDTNVSYAYLPGGDRIMRSNDTETIYYLYDRENVIAVLDSSGNPIESYLHGKGIDEPVAMRNIDGTHIFVQDGQGSTVATVFGSAVFAAYIYDARGNLEGYFGNMARDIRFLYTGREYDWQTGGYHYRARSYDANLGRFLQRDPAGMADGTNLYVYCGNDPVNGRDPSGMVSSLYGGWVPLQISDPAQPIAGPEHSEPGADSGTEDCAYKCRCKGWPWYGVYNCNIIEWSLGYNDKCYADCNFAGAIYILFRIGYATWMKPHDIGVAHM